MEMNGGFLVTKIKQLGDRIFEKILSEKNIDAFNGAQGRILYVLWQEDGISIRSPSCFILVTRNPPFISIQKLLYSSLLKTYYIGALLSTVYMS